MGSCPVIRARIERRGNDLFVAIEDAHGRTSERTVSDAEGAAALVESWMRDDLIEPLLTGRSPGGTAPLLADPIAAPAAEAHPPQPSGESIVGFVVAGETAVALDASVWFGAHLAGCVRLGPSCLGVLVRFGADSGLTGDSAANGTRRLGLDVLVVADFPFDCGPVWLTPGIGFGAGWMNASRTVATTEGDDGVDANGGGMRADAHATLTIPVGADLAVDVGLGLDVWILAHTAPYEEDGVMLAGEPRARFRGVIGLRYGAP